MEKWLSRFLITILVVFILGYFCSYKILGVLTTFGAIYIILVSLYKSQGLSKAFGVIMLLAGTSILWSKQVSFDVWATSFRQNLPIISLILLVPILSIPINLGGYNEQIQNVIKKFSKNRSLVFLSISSVFFILGPILNLGSIRIVNDMIKRLKFPSEFLAKAYTRGFTSVITWSPYFASAFLVVYYLDVTLTVLLPLGLVMGIVQFVFGNLLFFWEGSHKYELPLLERDIVNRKKLIELMGIILILTATILMLEQWLNVSIMVIVILSVFFLSVLWSIYLGEFHSFWKEISMFSSSILPGRANEIVLFLLSGFFSSALALTSFGKIIKIYLIQLSSISVFLFIFSLIFIISFLSMLGIHQVVSVSSIIAIVTAQELGVTNIILGLAFLSSWSISSIVSPIAAVNVTISSLVNIKVHKIILRNNLVFSAGSLLLHSSFIYLIYLMF